MEDVSPNNIACRMMKEIRNSALPAISTTSFKGERCIPLRRGEPPNSKMEGFLPVPK